MNKSIKPILVVKVPKELNHIYHLSTDKTTNDLKELVNNEYHVLLVAGNDDKIVDFTFEILNVDYSVTPLNLEELRIKLFEMQEQK